MDQLALTKKLAKHYRTILFYCFHYINFHKHKVKEHIVHFVIHCLNHIRCFYVMLLNTLARCIKCYDIHALNVINHSYVTISMITIGVFEWLTRFWNQPIYYHFNVPGEFKFPQTSETWHPPGKTSRSE